MLENRYLLTVATLCFNLIGSIIGIIGLLFNRKVGLMPCRNGVICENKDSDYEKNISTGMYSIGCIECHG